MLEREFQPTLIEALKEALPGCYIIKQDANQRQGIPDLLVLWEDRWALLETKRGLKAAKQPNQDYYVEIFHQMSYSAFVNPDNYLEVVDEIQTQFATA